MFSFFKSKPQATRQLTDVNDLQVGDMLQVQDSFAYPAWLKGQTLRVTAVNTYQYQRSAEYEFVCETDNGRIVFLSVSAEDGERWLNFAVKIERDDVQQIFGLDEFSRIFDEDGLTNIRVAEKPDDLARMLADEYQQSQAPYVGYFHNKDYRDLTLPQYVDDQDESCEIIELLSPCENFALYAEIWDGGDTDVILTMSRPVSDIVAFFPGS